MDVLWKLTDVRDPLSQVMITCHCKQPNNAIKILATLNYLAISISYHDTLPQRQQRQFVAQINKESWGPNDQFEQNMSFPVFRN